MSLDTHYTNVWEREGSSGQVRVGQFSRDSKGLKAVEFYSNLVYTERLGVLHTGNHQPFRGIHGNANIVCCLQITCKSILSNEIFYTELMSISILSDFFSWPKM